ncbi:MAG: MerR family transcriptional regulator [Rhizobiaceae bacterium]
MNVSLSITQVTPGQAAKITGVSLARQRDYRRHGFLPETDDGKHSRFNLFDVARLFLLHTFGEHGMRPKQAAEIIDICAAGVAFRVLGDVDAYSGDHLALIDAGLVAPSTLSDNELVTMRGEAVKIGVSDPEEIFTNEAFDEVAQAQFLQPIAAKGFGIRVVPAEYLIIWSDKSEYWADSIDAAFDDVAETDDRRAGPITVLSLASIARQIIDRSQLPFVSVQLADAEEIPAVKRHIPAPDNPA